MTSERTREGFDSSKTSGDTDSDRSARKDEPIEEAEKDLSRYSTSDSRPPVAEQERTSVDSDAQQAARDAKAEREQERE